MSQSYTDCPKYQTNLLIFTEKNIRIVTYAVVLNRRKLFRTSRDIFRDGDFLSTFTL